MAEAPHVRGTVADGFEPVREAFVRNFVDYGEVGASCAVCLDGELVVDMWAGHTDRERTRPWEHDTIVNLYSTTKGITALAAHMLADRGLIDFDAPVTDYWSEFGKAGKNDMPVRWLLTHQAGLPVIDAELPDHAAIDWDLMVSALEAQEPVWEPGTKQGYHAVTFGWLVGEVVRRVANAPSVGDFIAREIVAPLGIDLFVGTPESEHSRVATLVREQQAQPAAPAGSPALQDPAEAAAAEQAFRELAAALSGPDSLMRRALSLASRPFAPGNNDPRWRAAEVPAANGHGNARALATIYGALARGGETRGTRLLSPDAVQRAATEQVRSPDAVLVRETRRSLGYMLPVPGTPDQRSPSSFGHAGAGGSLGYADPERGIGFGYAMNKMWNGGFMQPDPRAQNLIAGLHRSLDGS